MRKYKALIFDLDDTLYPEREFVVSGFRAAGKWIGSNLGRPAAQAAADLIGLHDAGIRRDTFNRWLGANGLEIGKYVKDLVRIYREHAPVIKPFPAVPQLLTRLHRSYRIGLVSDGLVDVQRRKLAALGLSDRLDAVVFSDELGRKMWKPDPKPFEVALSKLGSSPGDAAYIADNPTKDFLGPRRMGMGTIRVRYAGGYYASCKAPAAEYAPEFQIDDIADLESILGQA